jgi:hypothetical protein
VKSILLIFAAGLLLAACATATGEVIPWPSPIELAQPPTALEPAGLTITISSEWTPLDVEPSYFSWRGPLRPSGYATLRLVYRDDYPHTLDDLVVSALRIEGVAAPSEPAPANIAGGEGRQTSGLAGVLNHKVIAVAWRREARTYLLAARWSEEIDGATLAAMVRSIAPLEPNAVSP